MTLMTTIELRIEAQAELDRTIEEIAHLEPIARNNIANEAYILALQEAYKKRAELNTFLRMIGQFER